MWPTPPSAPSAPKRSFGSIDLGARPAIFSDLIAVKLTCGDLSWVPVKNLARAADSRLARMLRGEMAVAKDESGRPVIDCDPKRWAQVQEYLSIGAVPRKTSDALMKQADQFGLADLVEQLKIGLFGVLSFIHKARGFEAKFSFDAAAASRGEQPHAYCVHSDGGLAWTLQVDPSNLRLTLAPLSDAPNPAPKFSCDVHLRLHTKTPHDLPSRSINYTGGPTQVSWPVVELRASLDELVSCEQALRHGALVLSMHVQNTSVQQASAPA